MHDHIRMNPGHEDRLAGLNRLLMTFFRKRRIRHAAYLILRVPLLLAVPDKEDAFCIVLPGEFVFFFVWIKVHVIFLPS